MALPALKLDTPVLHEDNRLAALERYDVLDTPAEPAFDRVATLIRMIFGVETSIVSLIDAHRQWYKAAQGTSDTKCRRTKPSAATPSRAKARWW